ncbi:MAG: hypothetical protein R2713_23590, partial [Ilumatobacteraceae bacterium]
GPYAVPATAEAYERWLDQCVTWGIETFEHDWLVEVFFGTRPLRAVAGRARAWQEGIDRAAAERGITLQWCMATPADMAQTVTLTQVTSVRTSGDHGYIATPGQLWAWFCTTSVLARALGLAPFKDVFRGDPAVAGHHGEPEALLSALSTGPVGVGDRVGRLDPALVMRTCRADGILIKPHVPVAATSASMTNGAAGRSVLMVAECFSDHPAGRWAYVVTMRCNPRAGATTGDVRLGTLGESAPTGPVVVWDWRRRTATPMDADGSWTCTLRHQWDFRVVAPVLPSGIASSATPTPSSRTGDRVEVRSTDRGITVVVKGAGEQVVLTGWSAAPRAPTPSTSITARRPGCGPPRWMSPSAVGHESNSSSDHVRWPNGDHRRRSVTEMSRTPSTMVVMQIPPPACAVLACRAHPSPRRRRCGRGAKAITAMPCHQPLVFDARRVGALDRRRHLAGAPSVLEGALGPVVIVAAASAAWPRLLHLDRSVPVVDDLDRAITLAGGPAATVRSAA